MSNMRYKIHRVDLGCLDAQLALTRLQKQCLPYDEPTSTTSGYWWLVHSEDGVPVAFAGLVPSQRWSDCGYLCRAGVLPAHRGQGIQKKLIRVRIRQARALGWNWLITDTHDNPASANSLIARGFRLFNPTKPWGADSALYWRLEL
jgi:GNAT superfamily N-acetyltransferase